ncbi:beta-phosphoglucomutase [Vibrio rotiferianus]|uniref:HAD family hydrolase n=1 Tax=Vibrio rotiferianus TaxID=190895 RepID=UPI001110134D|nr:HAD family phosphatase [Vibrio rotiferianus]TMX31104.1 beta-phosphoglucomutase [Vibrio rotiferianus]TMX43295.1 beta-phosphoglucomutase [Vibrio rotiferianus]TMX59789.1 beta-phosphoglucomutase [Vibrio rotiferianus]
MENILKDYQVYLFDMDGTLVNSEPLKGKALALACADYGSEVDFNIYKDVMGESWSVVTGHFFEAASINPMLEEFNSHFRTHYERLLSDNLELNTGAKEYIEQLNKTGKTCGVVSSAATWMVDNILETLNLTEAFEIVITQEHVTKHKPDPEAYNLALSQLNTSPESTLIFEDSTAGILAGKSSGCEVIAIKHEFNSKNDMSAASKVIEAYDEMLVQQ